MHILLPSHPLNNETLYNNVIKLSIALFIFMISIEILTKLHFFDASYSDATRCLHRYAKRVSGVVFLDEE